MNTAIPMPSKIRALPRNKAGYPIPFFVATIDGQPDFRVMDNSAWVDSALRGKCWVCGRQRRKHEPDAFVVGPMCTVNRTTAEPPCHPECAEYAARACPFLATPHMVRRDRNMPEHGGPAGIMITRNPGVAAVYNTRAWRVFEAPGGGHLIELGKPNHVDWWREGRRATRAETIESIDTGMPLLREACDTSEAHAELSRWHERALRFLPAEAVTA